ncbi:MAG TPA: hypothetical protein VGD60_00855 [Candidatus Acidoferrales bacterium]
MFLIIHFAIRNWEGGNFKMENGVVRVDRAGPIVKATRADDSGGTTPIGAAGSAELWAGGASSRKNCRLEKVKSFVVRRLRRNLIAHMSIKNFIGGDEKWDLVRMRDLSGRRAEEARGVVRRCAGRGAVAMSLLVGHFGRKSNCPDSR